jgi:uncharacterized protein YgiM (DUF1202 family)
MHKPKVEHKELEMTTRKIFSTILMALVATALLISAAFSPAPALAAVGDDYVVNTAVLNLRTGPGFNYPVLRLLNQGQQVRLLKNSEDGIWSQIRLADGKEGWAYSTYLSPTSQDKPDTAYVLISRLNLRVGPGVTYRVLQTLDLGTELKVMGRNLVSDWLLVEMVDGTEGWVYSPLVQTSADIASLPVMEASGGPTSGGTTTTPVSTQLLVTIRNNVAIVDVSGFPGKTDLTVLLGLPGEELDLKVATGVTASDGTARLSFEMPAKWSDGTKVTQQTLVLMVRADDGSKSVKANIVYYR